jgi:hypothetical protein
MKNSARVTKMPQIMEFFLLYLFVKLNLKFYYENIFKIAKN